VKIVTTSDEQAFQEGMEKRGSRLLGNFFNPGVSLRAEAGIGGGAGGEKGKTALMLPT